MTRVRVEVEKGAGVLRGCGKTRRLLKKVQSLYVGEQKEMVELRGLEPLTPRLPGGTEGDKSP
jgi:hypothetical protein